MIDPAAAAAQLAFFASCAPGWRRFRQALADPRRAQEELLLRLVADNAETAFGREHGFSCIRSVDDYRRRVPIRRWDELGPWLGRAAAGEPGVLTAAPVRLLEPSSGSAAAAKLVPYGAPLQRQFRAAISPWVFDLFRRRPALLGGPSYWSVSPATPALPRPPGGIPVGFDDDAAYLGGAARRAAERALAVPSTVRHLADVDAFRRATLVHLLRARELRFASVWSPTFLALLLAPLAREWDALVDAVARGGEVGGRRVPPDRARARELARLSPQDTRRIWPRLALVSAWTDGPAAEHLAPLRALLPGVELEGKGLVATECIVSLPYGGDRLLAVRSHFFELDGGDGDTRLCDEVVPGRTYSVVVTTGGGLYRYRLGDRVLVTGMRRGTPALTFVGKEDRVADRFGEKLHEAFVGAALARLRREGLLGPGFALLAPDEVDGAPCYTLHAPAGALADGAAAGLERALAEGFHYAWCRRLGQLAPARVFAVEGDPWAAFYAECARRGQRLGDVKPSPLAVAGGWSRVFAGRHR